MNKAKPIHTGFMAATIIVAALVFSSITTPVGAAESSGFAVQIGDRLIDRSLASALIEPGESIDIAVADLSDTAHVTIETPGLSHNRKSAHEWRIDAPNSPGVYPITLRNRDRHTERRVNLFVQQPFDASNQAIEGYRIGHYQRRALRGRAIYAPPEALMPVNVGTTNARLSPHFTIGQFLCHQQPGHWPKYVLVRPLLIAKLEAILTELERRGIDANTLTIMSGYRTPRYNADIGNTTVYSRHLFGGAADLFVDTTGDGRMDDLNGDGRVDVEDAHWLFQLIDSLDEAEPRFTGGLSAYTANSVHGPFVHVDVRGVAARW